MSQNTKESIIPQTGRIGRLAKVIKEETNEEVLFSVMKDSNLYTSTSNNRKKAKWIKGAIEKLEEEVGEEKSKKIMESCGRMCCGITTRKRAKILMEESKNLSDFIEKLNQNRIGGGRLRFKDSNTIIGGYDKCYCGQVKQTEEKFQTKTYCHCSVGWYKQLFEVALRKSVAIELLQTIIGGADTCEFIIHI